jgi:Calx-beta domain
MNQYKTSTMQMFLLLVLFSAVTEVRAQEPANTIPLRSAQYRLNRIAPGQTSGQAVFTIDQSNVVTIEIIAGIADLNTSILGPSGQVVDPTTIDGLGGSFTTISKGASDSPLMPLSLSNSFRYIYSFPSLGSGNYTVRFQAPPALAKEIAVSTQVTTDSKIAVSLIATDPRLVLGGTAVLTAAIFNGTAQITGANVTVKLLPTSGPPLNLTLKDDGGPGDNAAGDGLYSGQFTPSTLGNYRASALIIGTSAGVSFTRQAATSFEVIAQNSRLTGNFTDQGFDDDSNSRFDRVAVDLETTTTRAGTYRVFVHLKTANGQRLVRSADVNLAAGMATIRVNFEAAAFLALGEPGPYNIELVELLFIDTTGLAPSDSLANVGQTKAYTLTQFQRAQIALTGIVSDQGVDDNSNSKFDRLVVSVQVNVLTSGFYSWGYKLSDATANEIDFASGNTFFNVGLNNLSVTFNGAKIGAHAVNGPYQLRDLLLQGAGTSLVVTDVGRTQAYQFTQFENAPFVQLSVSSFSVNENAGTASITVTRTGSITAAATANYVTSDTAGLQNCTVANGKASERCDYVTSVGTVSLGAGQSSKTINIPLINDALVEGNETFTIRLSDAAGAALGSLTLATVTIVDDDSSAATSNPIDGVEFFIREQYLDILNRQPDSIGFQNWVNTLTPCPNGGFGEPPTSNCDRLHVAAGFFQSDEFLNRGYWAFRFYMVSYNEKPTYAQFIPDMAQVGGPKSPAEEQASKVAFADTFVQRPEFLARYAGLTGQPLANALLQTAGLPSNTFTISSGMTNGEILRGVIETSAVFNKFLVDGTVSIQYFGFLRRDPDTIGYQNNLNTLKANPNNLRHMIFIFINSTEYRGRFGPQ